MATVAAYNWGIRTDHTAAQGGTPVWAGGDILTPDPSGIVAGAQFRIRFEMANSDTATSTASTLYTVYYSKNGGPFGPGTDILPVDATHGISANGQRLTTHYFDLTGAATYTGIGEYVSTANSPFAISIPPLYWVEFEFGLQFISPACDGNMYDLRIVPLTPGVDTYDYFSSANLFSMGNSAAAAITETDDAVTAAGNVPRAARLDALEVSDALTAAANVTNNAALTQTESNDTLLGSAYEGFVAYLTQTEADDSLIGVGSVTGVVSSLSVIEDNDALVSATLLWANQWLEAEGCAPSMWTPVDCGESLPPLVPPVVPPGGGGGGEVTVMELTMEQLPVSSLNQIGNFSHTPNMELCTLTVDGRPFFPVGSPPDFSVSGRSITWLSSIYSVDPSSTVIAQYSWISNG